MKKRDKIFVSVFVLLFLVSTLSFAFAQNPIGQIGDIADKVEETGDKVERLSREDVKWDYLGEWWEGFVLKNPVVAKLDEIFRKGNIVFVVLFGRDYSLSLTLIFLIMLWFYFWSQFNKGFSLISSFGSFTCRIVSLGAVVILTHLGFFNWAAEMIFKLVFYRDGVWGWIWNIGIFLVVIMVGMVLGKFFTSLKKSVLKFKDEAYRKKLLGELEQKNKFLGIMVDAFRGMWKKD